MSKREEEGKYNIGRNVLMHSIVICLTAVIIGSFAIPGLLAQETGAAVEVRVTPESEYVEEGATFSVTIDVDDVTEFKNGNFDLSFNSSVLELKDVEDGSLDGEIIPIISGNLVDAGTVRVVCVVSEGTASGSGHLAKVSFKVIGAEGKTTKLDISDGELSDTGTIWFYIDEEFRDVFNGGKIPDEVEEELKSRGRTLENPTVDVIEKDNKWKITDKRVYMVIAKDSKLRIQDTGEIFTNWVDAEISVGGVDEEKDEEEGDVLVNSESEEIKIWPSEAPGPTCWGSDGRPCPSTGPNSASWFHYRGGGCGGWKVFPVSPGTPIRIYGWGDDCPSCVLWHINYWLDDYYDGEWHQIAYIDGPDYRGCRHNYSYTPQGTKIRIRAATGFYVAVYQLISPTVLITTDGFEYCPGDMMTITINISNPTQDNLTFHWYWGVPQYSIWVPVMSEPIPAGYNETLNFRIPCPSLGLKPSGNLFYVQLLDTNGEVLDADVVCWSCSPSGEMMPLMGIAEHIKKTIERVELSNL